MNVRRANMKHVFIQDGIIIPKEEIFQMKYSVLVFKQTGSSTRIAEAQTLEDEDLTAAPSY